ncbi:MAG: dihydroorotate dehydrogenase electron transfer subunit, partial [Bacteroidetes bacterium]|nr:dihydroorotate dehydrogenase electron transfer subunit [Bacteroidota bacterium]
TEVNCRKPLVVGGGVGIPPLYRLTKELVAKGKKPTAILCFNTASEIFLHNEFAKLGIEVAVATIDGSYGTKGFYSDAIVRHNIEYDYYYTCGPQPMLRSIHATLDVEGQISFEERMGCGFGGCMGCSHKTRSGYKRVCTDTILKSEEVIFDEH